MTIKYISTLALLLTSLSLQAQGSQQLQPTSVQHIPYLHVGLTGGVGVHRAMGPKSYLVRAEESSWQYNMRPELNPGGQAGLTIDIGKSARHMALRVTGALTLQHYEWDYDVRYMGRSHVSSTWTQKISETNFATDFSLRAVWSSFGKHPFKCAFGGYAGFGLLTRTRSYAKLAAGNFIRPRPVAIPAGLVVQCSKQYAVKGWQLEPFLEAKNSFNFIVWYPNMSMLSLQAGLVAWIPNRDN
jgi:hypothetical protein